MGASSAECRLLASAGLDSAARPQRTLPMDSAVVPLAHPPPFAGGWRRAGARAVAARGLLPRRRHPPGGRRPRHRLPQGVQVQVLVRLVAAPLCCSLGRPVGPGPLCGSQRWPLGRCLAGASPGLESAPVAGQRGAGPGLLFSRGSSCGPGAPPSAGEHFRLLHVTSGLVGCIKQAFACPPCCGADGARRGIAPWLVPQLPGRSLGRARLPGSCIGVRPPVFPSSAG